MSNTNASEDNVESPSTYGREAYEGSIEKRKKRKSRKEKKQNMDRKDITNN